MNTTIQDIITRRSIKKYLDKDVPMELIEQVVKAGTYAPTGRNKQSPIILAVTNKEIRNKLSKMNAEILGIDSDPFYGAPIVLVVLAKKEVVTHIYDGTLVMENMMIAANSLGLGTYWIHRAKETFDSKEGKQILADLGITEEYEGIGNCILGYAAPDALKPQPERKEDYVVWVK